MMGSGNDLAICKCVEKECAWWEVNSDKCAIVTIPDKLDELIGEMIETIAAVEANKEVVKENPYDKPEVETKIKGKKR
jgi:hypothetical protein